MGALVCLSPSDLCSLGKCIAHLCHTFVFFFFLCFCFCTHSEVWNKTKKNYLHKSFFFYHLSIRLRPLAPTKHKKLLPYFTVTKYEECNSLNALWGKIHEMGMSHLRLLALWIEPLRVRMGTGQFFQMLKKTTKLHLWFLRVLVDRFVGSRGPTWSSWRELTPWNVPASLLGYVTFPSIWTALVLYTPELHFIYFACVFCVYKYTRVHGCTNTCVFVYMKAIG